MTSTNQTSSGSKANLVSSSPELLTRPASKPGDRPISSTGELCTYRIGRRRGDESHFLSARVDLKRPNHFLAPNRTELHFTTLRALRRSGCSACSAYPYEKIRNRAAVGKDSAFRKVEALGQHFCDIQAVDFVGVSRFLQITQNFSNAEIQAETTAEILLRFAETSQQTLRHFSRLPTTYINFAEKNALKSKLLRHLTHTTIVDSRNARREQARVNRQPRSPLTPMVHFHSLIVFLPARPFASSVKNISSPFYFTVPHKPFAFSSFHRIADKVKFLSNLISPPHFIFFSPFHSRSLLRDFAVLSEIKSVHFVGICGTAMASAAAAMQDRGFKVSGSDQNVYPPMSTFLEERGIQLMSGYREENLASKPDLVVIGNAISRGNAEAEAVLEKKLRYCSLPELLKEFFIRGKKSLVVSGTHGKTTTTSLLTWVFEANRRDPSYLIGGIPNNLKQGAKFTKSDWFIIEGDEYDTAFFDKRSKFVHYLPELVIINNLEFDHADIFENLAAIQLSFKRLINIVPRNGLVLANGDDSNIGPLLEVKHCPVRRFGLGENCDVRATNLKLTESGSEFQLGSGTFRIPLIGELNVRNALAVVAAARHYGLSDKEIQNAFNSFEGIKRRLELRGVSGGISVIDDFAHHPTAIRETMRALRVRFPGQRVWAVFEPRSNTTRRNVFQNELAEALGLADGVCVAQVARLEQLQPHERLDPDRLIQSLQQAGKPAFYLPTADAIVDRLAIEARSPDVICVFSNGGFGGIHEKLLSRFQTSAN